jgi:hypothetical protein
MLDYGSSDGESKEVCAAEFTWLPNDKANNCASLKPAHKSQDGMKFTFDVAKCDKIFDELFKSGKIKMSHTIPPLDQLKRRAYYNFHNSFSHATNDCNTFCREIQSAINEGHLKFHEMQVDENPFPNSAFVNTLSCQILTCLFGRIKPKTLKGRMYHWRAKTQREAASGDACRVALGLERPPRTSSDIAETKEEYQMRLEKL